MKPNDPLRGVARRYLRDLRPRGLPPLSRWDFPCHVAIDVEHEGQPELARILKRYTLIARYEFEGRRFLEENLPPRSAVYAPINQGRVRPDGLYSAPLAPGVEGVEEITDPARIDEIRVMNARLRRLTRADSIGTK